MNKTLSSALLKRLLKAYIRTGSLRVIDPSGRPIDLGDDTGPTLTVRFNNPAIIRKLALNPALHMPEGYMNGDIEIEGGSIYDFLLLLKKNRGGGKKSGAKSRNKSFQKLIRRLFQFNPASVASRNARHHYDLNADMYRLFLDADMQYSCGYFENETDELETAQAAKKRHIAAKLCIEPGMRVLDIGCGWGGMAIYLARECGAEVVGVTLSPEQRRIAEERASEAGVAGRISFLEQDYRAVEGPFDRIVSVGMFEHVGVAHYAEFFNKIRALLTDDASRCCTPSRAETALVQPMNLSAGTSFRVAIRRQFQRLFQQSRKPGCSSMISRSGGTITVTPAATGESASPPTATKLRRSTTNAFAACGSSIWPPVS